VGLLNVPSAAIVKKVAVFARVPEMSSFVIRKVVAVAVAVVFPAPAKAAGTEAIANRIGQIDRKNLPINFVIDFLAICFNRESRSGSRRRHYTPARGIRSWHLRAISDQNSPDKNFELDIFSGEMDYRCRTLSGKFFSFRMLGVRGFRFLGGTDFLPAQTISSKRIL
jgi:hypothetical protein